MVMRVSFESITKLIISKTLPTQCFPSCVVSEILLYVYGLTSINTRHFLCLARALFNIIIVSLSRSYNLYWLQQVARMSPYTHHIARHTGFPNSHFVFFNWQPVSVYIFWGNLIAKWSLRCISLNNTNRFTLFYITLQFHPLHPLKTYV